MTYVLDTDILTLLQEGDAAVRAHVTAQAPRDVSTTVISIEEQLSGWYTMIRQAKQPDKLAFAYAKLATAIRSLSGIVILDYSLAAIGRFDSLRKFKLNVRLMDLRIAAIVLENNATLVTRNTRDFQQVPGLVAVDWSK